MSGGMVFDWRSLGKPDYSQACALVASIPAAQRNQMSGRERELLCRITFLTWSYASKSGRGIGYCVPSQRWLSGTIARSERSTRRYLVRLRKLGLLTWKCRMTNLGAWTSSLYTLGANFLASLIARKGKKTQQIQARTKLADNDLKREYKAAADTSEPAIIVKYQEMKRLQPTISPEGASWEESPSVEDEKKRVQERLALLKRQAESLKARGL